MKKMNLFFGAILIMALVLAGFTACVSIPRVTSVTVSTTSNIQEVGLGSTIQFSAVAVGEAVDDVEPDLSVRWSVSSDRAGTGPVRAGTTIDQNGLLTIAPDESVHSLYVRATSVQTRSRYDTVQVTLATVIQGVTISPENPSVLKGSTLNFTARVVGSGSPDQSVTWIISTNRDGTGTVSAGTEISPNGVLTVAANESASIIYVRAASAGNPDYFDLREIRITESVFTVTFNSNGGSTVAPLTNVTAGSTITTPTSSRDEFFVLEGWYKDAALSDRWTEADTVTSDITLYAKWTTGRSIGDTGPGGGIIFHVAPDGFTVEGYTGPAGTFASYTAHYLEVAPSNHSSQLQWSNQGTAISGVTTFTSNTHTNASAIGNGRKDTMIIAAHLNTNPEASQRAAQIAAAANLGDLNDWFLPSIGELRLLYAQNTGITDFLWSSTQYSNNSAWGLSFRTGFYSTAAKNQWGYVRVIRAF